MWKEFLHNSTSIPLYSVRYILVCTSILIISVFSPLNGYAVGPANSIQQTAENKSWDSLSAAQKQALAPLAHDWNQFALERKQKWLAIAEKYQQMKPDEQKRTQEKMQEWVKLTPEQRFSARENYIRSNKLQPDQRNQKWQEYQQLTDAQKEQLAKHPDKRKLITNLPTPAESKVEKLQPLKESHRRANTAPVSNSSVKATDINTKGANPSLPPATPTVKTDVTPAAAPPVAPVRSQSTTSAPSLTNLD